MSKNVDTVVGILVFVCYLPSAPVDCGLHRFTSEYGNPPVGGDIMQFL